MTDSTLRELEAAWRASGSVDSGGLAGPLS